MTVWVIRVVEDTGKEAEALSQGTCITGWDRVPDFRGLKDVIAIKSTLSKLFPAKNNAGLSGWASQIMTFRDLIQPGDSVIMPSKDTPWLHVGVVDGPYEFVDVGGKPRHQRRVKWCGRIAKNASHDAHSSLGAFLSVFRVDKPRFTAAVHEVVKARSTPGLHPEAE